MQVLYDFLENPFFVLIWFVMASIGVAMHNYEQTSIFRKTLICTGFALFSPIALMVEIYKHTKHNNKQKNDEALAQRDAVP